MDAFTRTIYGKIDTLYIVLKRKRNTIYSNKKRIKFLFYGGDFIEEFYDLDKPLVVDGKGRYYLPDKIYCDALTLSPCVILVNTPSVGVIAYTVYTNKDGSRWIKGNKIIKYYSNCPNKIPTRLFLSKNVISQIDEVTE